jgi:hypothetical protein
MELVFTFLMKKTMLITLAMQAFEKENLVSHNAELSASLKLGTRAIVKATMGPYTAKLSWHTFSLIFLG